MGKNSKIDWTDHTFNPWIGCKKVSPGCEHCYAERDNKRYNWVESWGLGQYHLTRQGNWQQPVLWGLDAIKRGVIERIFCLSLGDFLDPGVPKEWRNNLFTLINKTGKLGGLEWLLLTKRMEYAEEFLPEDWLVDAPPYVRIGITCENQEMFDKRTSELLKCWAGKNFISVEPMLSTIDTHHLLDEKYTTTRLFDWVICGCESGPGARPCNDDWVRRLRDQCNEGYVPFFLKQLYNHDNKLEKIPFLDGRQWAEYPNPTISSY